ncbi:MULTISPECIES: type VI secretion system baseplate subunit TssG [Citrobacter]|uniref:type VI secretion system baseplate subunit TssG n=1 Tax=Citrobacter TaxID=544 RepID=UPI000CDDA2CC|nr:MULTISPECIES: type VI secretion system baseplate subunit TssG [Citrobacter]MBJ9573342.1 type VI secretion system baseplate subunit TssG [Citrobacter braakii]POT29242.1 type VI secretion system baseplate subunit TssG [Citrobacter braakii]POT34101.1 type VI secretion system baseplate subunit TssG [Citrobacter braakii]POT38926.1 type VI secretion system baseplate subunit TssG [Citrobacter braakii]POU80469.1 type VI secretion system baseplate subunit TssG [Citrobacter braakii]
MDLTSITSRFNFYQQVRTLLHKLRGVEGCTTETLDRKFHFVSPLSLDAPAGQIVSIKQETRDAPLYVTVGQYGLTGALGVLPTTYTEWMITRQYRYGDHSAKAFLDMFGHRLYCLDYLAWQKNHLYALAEAQTQSPIELATLALTGLLTSRSVSGGENYAHLFSSPVRSLANLEVWLSHYYGVPVHITPFTGGWNNVDQDEYCQLGKPDQCLETAPVIGQVRWDIQSHFDVTLGPMAQQQSQHFIPQGKFYREIWKRIGEYIGPGLKFSVHLSVTNGSSPTLALGCGQLGLDICIGQRDPVAQRLIYLPQPD